MSDEEFLDEDEFASETGEHYSSGAEFIPEGSSKPKSDIYTVLLILAFLAFFTGSIVAGNELYENYDVQFWVLEKK
ncbi:MAG: hypothetical protein QF645_05065 [Planctomycetota bacterium]|nr:hypothetical protein [Planctomycetota bacterium]